MSQKSESNSRKWKNGFERNTVYEISPVNQLQDLLGSYSIFAVISMRTQSFLTLHSQQSNANINIVNTAPPEQSMALNAITRHRYSMGKLLTGKQRQAFNNISCVIVNLLAVGCNRHIAHVGEVNEWQLVYATAWYVTGQSCIHVRSQVWRALYQFSVISLSHPNQWRSPVR